ncbi:hypothetical protein NKDENANG_00328 [Candidatus Entotheonellaceae bacterium PAL068K]
MEILHLELLGSPSIRLGEQPLAGFTTMKAQALLMYLAVTPGMHSRDTLASLLWRDMPNQQARKNLRNTLPNLRALVGSHLIITRHAVAFNRASPYHLDVEAFRSALAAHQTVTNLQVLKDATALYRDDFLTGFHVRAAPAFEEWTLMECEYLRDLAIDGLLALATQCIKQHTYELGLSTTKRLLSLDPWCETAYQQQMLLLAYSGQRNAALTQYEACRTILGAELDVEPMEETTALYEQIKANALPYPRALRVSLSHPDTGVNPRVDWTEFPKRTPCYGRHTELTQLHQWLMANQACLVGIFGLGGQGKTALATHLVWGLAKDGAASQPQSSVAGQRFEYIIWRSLTNAPPFTTVLQGWLTFLSEHQITHVPSHLDEQLAVLFDHLRQQRCLLILDNVECILHRGPAGGECRPDYDAYMQLLHQLGHRVHRSCLMLISRERPRGFNALETHTDAVRSMHLGGLPAEAGEQLLYGQGVAGRHEAIRDLIAWYAGHPLALKLVAMTVHKFFGGDLEAFLTDTPPILDDLLRVLDQQFTKLSPLEKEIMMRLRDARAPMMFQTLWDQLRPPPSRHAILEALRVLCGQSLIETSTHGFGLQHMVMEYVTHCMIETVP